MRAAKAKNKKVSRPEFIFNIKMCLISSKLAAIDCNLLLYANADLLSFKVMAR